MLRYVICVFFLISVPQFIKAATSSELPEGWSEASIEHLDNVASWRNDSVNYFTVVAADFDGDGLDDTAKLLVKEHPQTGSINHVASALWVFLSTRKSGIKLVTISGSPLYEGITVHNSGTISSNFYQDDYAALLACAEERSPHEYVIPNDALVLFSPGAPSVLYFWCKARTEFIKFHLSD